MSLFSSFDAPAPLTSNDSRHDSLPPIAHALDSRLNRHAVDMLPRPTNLYSMSHASPSPIDLPSPRLSATSHMHHGLPISMFTDSTQTHDTPRSRSSFAMPPLSAEGSHSLDVVADPEVTPLAVDNLAKDFGLDEEQRSILQTFLKFGKVGRGLPAADLLTRLYTNALMLHLENKRPKDDENTVQTLRGLVNDLRIRLQTFSLSPTQTKLIRLIAHDKIYDPMRTCYIDIGKDVFAHLRANAELLGFSNVIGNPAYESALEARINKVCSSVRNQFRQHVIDSITKKPISAADFTHNMNKIYCRPGGPDFNQQYILLRNIVLRRFVYDNRQICWATEEDENEDADGDAPEGTTRKRKRGGRVAKGLDFWSLMDAWYDEKKKELGKKLSDPRWKLLLEDYAHFDEAGFKNVGSPSSSNSSRAPTPSEGHSGSHSLSRGNSTLAALIG
ncbi:hypothetical protein F5880DRAFT_1697810 [Lentinula raphanica]|nr:hypothetical protein F5880DRAFT_1697810 [Lentinula raphanica]